MSDNQGAGGVNDRERTDKVNIGEVNEGEGINVNIDSAGIKKPVPANTSPVVAEDCDATASTFDFSNSKEATLPIGDVKTEPEQPSREDALLVALEEQVHALPESNVALQQPLAPNYPSEVVFNGDDSTCVSSVTRNLTDLHDNELYPSLYQLHIADEEAPPASALMMPQQTTIQEEVEERGHDEAQDTKAAAIGASQSSDPEQSMLREKLQALERDAITKSATISAANQHLTALEDNVLGKTGVASRVLQSERLSPPASDSEKSFNGDHEKGDQGKPKTGTTSNKQGRSLPGAYHEGGLTDSNIANHDAATSSAASRQAEDISQQSSAGEQDEEQASAVMSTSQNQASADPGLASLPEPSGAATEAQDYHRWQGITPTVNANSGEGMPPSLPVAQSIPEGHRIPSASMEQEPFLMRPKKVQARSHFRIYAAAIAALVCIVAAVIIVSVVATGQDKNPAMTQREKTGLSTKEDLEAVFGTDFFDDDTSAQAMAWDWLTYDDPLQLPANATNVRQRFLVAFLYFSTSQLGPWRNCTPADANSGETDLCFYDGLLGDGTYTESGRNYEPAYERFEEMVAIRWLSGVSECQWAGLFCDSNDEIDAIHLDDMLLNGTFPSEISHLTSLRSISLTRNGLSGPLPSELGSLSELEFLGLEDNALTGSIPSQLFDASVGPAARSLRHLDLAYNPLTASSIPLEIQSMSNLENLFLDAVGLTGTLPTELFELTKLSWLVARRNEIRGTIPTELGRLQDLNIISFNGCLLTSTIPSEVGLLTSLQEFDLWNNPINGTIPEEVYLGDFQELNALLLGRTNLSGTISTNIGRLTNLGYFFISKNIWMTGTVPTEVGLLTDLSSFNVDRSGLVGSIPEELCALRGDDLLATVRADCEELANGTTPMICPLGCCTHCCNSAELTCTETIYNDGFNKGEN